MHKTQRTLLSITAQNINDEKIHKLLCLCGCVKFSISSGWFMEFSGGSLAESAKKADIEANLCHFRNIYMNFIFAWFFFK